MTTAAPLRSPKWPIIRNYAIAVVSAAASVVVAFSVYPPWGADPAALLFLSVVAFLALSAGPGPARLRPLLSFLSLQSPLLSNGHALVLRPSEILRSGLFIVAS